MLVVACICFWDCREILPYAVRQWHKLGVDVIIVYSNSSNYRTVVNNTEFLKSSDYKDCHIFRCEPKEFQQPADNERMKRNFGLQKARELGYTHFITADADELYDSIDVDWDAAGTVVGCQTYFKSPKLTIGLDRTLVPFVHKITPTIAHAWNRAYPYAFDLVGIRIDPTRQMNINKGVVFNDSIVMSHYSWVRKNYDVKIENSTARNNIKRSTILKDLANAKDGYFCEFYQKTLRKCDNIFGIPEF